MARRGYTLLELVLVMAIIVVVAGVSIPVIDSMLNPNRLVAARDLVRGNLAEMRGRAMSENRAYRFQVMENTGKFKIEPADGNGAQGSQTCWMHEDELPEQILFTMETKGNSSPSSNSDWQTVVVFLPDGSAQDSAEIRFCLDGQQPILLRVRDFTGAISTPDPNQKQEVEP